MTSPEWPSGLITALVTPLRGDELDVGALETLIDAQVAARVGGILVCGGTGEFGVLTLHERRPIAEHAVRHAAGRVPITVNVSALATRDAVELSVHAQVAGAAGILVASPFGEPLNWRERAAFYRDVNASVDLPIMLYNTPIAPLLTVEQIASLVELSNVSAIKDSGGDAIFIADLVEMIGPEELSVYVGIESLLADALLAGARGALLGVGNFLATTLVPLVAAFAGGDNDEGTAARWRDVRRLLRFIENAPNYVALVKAACAVCGTEVGDVRPPFLMPTPEEVSEFRGLLAAVVGAEARVPGEA
jgi:4-hydroxy-tetrahydrodipicolinate synthase